MIAPFVRGQRLSEAVAWWAAAAAALASVAAGLWILVADARAGLDLTDESLYLLSADNHQPTAALNGWFGRYTGLLFAALGHDVAWFRIAGVLLLVVCAAILGVAIVRLLDSQGTPALPRPGQLAVIAGVTAAALVNYALFIRTPGYNWLTFIGALLAAAGLIWALAPGGTKWRDAVWPALLLSLGCFLALWGKASAGLGLGLVAAIVLALPDPVPRGWRVRVGIVALGFTAALLVLHSLFIADPLTTVTTMRRSLLYLTVMEPQAYDPSGAIGLTLEDLISVPGKVFRATSGLVLLGLAPLGLRAAPRFARPVTAGVLVGGAILIVAAVLLARGQWLGGVRGYSLVAIADLAVLTAATLGAITTWIALAPAERSARSDAVALSTAALVAVGAAAIYAFGSANGFVRQSTGATGLVLAAAGLVAAAPLPRPIGGALAVLVSLVMAVTSVVVLDTARAAPYRMAPLATASVAIEFGPHRQALIVDTAAAGYWRALEAAARGAGWTPRTRLLDLTWSPAVPYELGATVPETVVPMAGSYETGEASAIEALRVSDPAAWADTWLLVSPDIVEVSVARVVASFGRSFPADYDLVIRLAAPGLGLRQELWRPVSGPLALGW